MISQTQHVDPVADALDEAARFNHRAKVSAREHRPNLYRKKDQFLLQALAAAPEQFIVDSLSSSTPVAGISHLRSGRRFHVMLDRAPAQMRQIIQRLPRRLCVGDANELDDVIAGMEAGHAPLRDGLRVC